MDQHTTRRDTGRRFGPSARLTSGDDAMPAVGSVALLERARPDGSERGRAGLLAPVRSAPVFCGAAVSAAPPAIPPSTVPDLSTPSTVPDLSTTSTVPDLSTPSTVPDLSSPSTVPDLSTPSTVPDLSTPSTVPDLSTPSTVPHRVPDGAPEPAPSGDPRRPSRRTARPAARRPPARIIPVRPAVAVNCLDPESEGPGYRMGRWTRLAVTLTVVATVVIAAVSLISHGGHDGTAFVTVEPGDTLWSVAIRTAPDRDPRDVIADVIALNELRSGDVHVGEVLRVPVG